MEYIIDMLTILDKNRIKKLIICNYNGYIAKHLNGGVINEYIYSYPWCIPRKMVLGKG